MYFIMLIDLQMLNHPHTLQINSTWLGCVVLLMYYYIQFANIFVDICIYVYLRCWTITFLFDVCSPGLVLVSR